MEVPFFEHFLSFWRQVGRPSHSAGTEVCSVVTCRRLLSDISRALPFSKWLYQMNSSTGAPVNVILFDAIGALLLGLLVFAGNQAVNAVFSVPITATYIAYMIPVVVRYTGGNEFQPGPFNLGTFVRTVFFSNFDAIWPTPFIEPSCCYLICAIYDSRHRYHTLSYDSIYQCCRHELHSGYSQWGVGTLCGLVLFPEIRGISLVPRSRTEY